jgi:hypothetical protein
VEEAENAAHTTATHETTIKEHTIEHFASNITTNKTEHIYHPEEEIPLEPTVEPEEPQTPLPMVEDLPPWAPIDEPVLIDTGPLLKSTFKTLRAEVFDNHFMTGDTIALAYFDEAAGEHLYLDTGTNPLVMRKRSEIIEETDFWVTPNFWFGGPVENLMGLRKWPDLSTMKAGEWWTRKGAVINVNKSDKTASKDDYMFERVGDDSIIIRCEAITRQSKPHYFVVMGDHKELRAIASKETATRFKVLRIKERLRTRIRGVNLASWFWPNAKTGETKRKTGELLTKKEDFANVETTV